MVWSNEFNSDFQLKQRNFIWKGQIKNEKQKATTDDAIKSIGNHFYYLSETVAANKKKGWKRCVCSLALIYSNNLSV